MKVVLPITWRGQSGKAVQPCSGGRQQRWLLVIQSPAEVSLGYPGLGRGELVIQGLFPVNCDYQWIEIRERFSGLNAEYWLSRAQNWWTLLIQFFRVVNIDCSGLSTMDLSPLMANVIATEPWIMKTHLHWATTWKIRYSWVLNYNNLPVLGWIIPGLSG